MKSTLSLFALTASMIVSLFIVSCGDKAETADTPKDTADSISDEMVSGFSELVTALESAKDKASAEKAATKINGIADKLVAIAGRLEALGDPSEADVKLVKEKMDKAEEANKAKMESIFQGMMTKPEVAPILGKAMQDFSKKLDTVESTFKKYGKED